MIWVLASALGNEKVIFSGSNNRNEMDLTSAKWWLNEALKGWLQDQLVRLMFGENMSIHFFWEKTSPYP